MLGGSGAAFCLGRRVRVLSCPLLRLRGSAGESFFPSARGLASLLVLRWRGPRLAAGKGIAPLPLGSLARLALQGGC